jgi:glycosyltransferase involved in cell wall biosynthesis
MMRVLLLTDSDAFSGTERYILDLAEYLPRHHAQAVIACPLPSPLGDQAGRAGLETLHVAKGGLLDREAISLLRKGYARRQFQLVHANNGRTAFAAALAGIPAIASQHFLEPDHTQRRGPFGVAYRGAHHWVNKRLRHHIAISGAVREAMMERRDVSPDRVTVVPNGVQAPDPERLTAPSAIRAELGVEPRAPLVVCVARLEREKSIITLIDAMDTVRKAFPRVRCLVAGEGYRRPDLEERIRELNLEEHFELLGFRTDALSVVNAGDVFVLPSLAEPSGLAILEAMALGKPVIATRAGGPVEIVEDGVTGLLAPPRDPPALARAIEQLLQDRTQRERMGEEGARRFRELYTADEMARGTAQVYRKALGLA